MLIYGAGGHAKIVIECLRAQNILVSCVFDDNPDCKQVLDCEVVGLYDPLRLPDEKLILALGNNSLRKKVSGLVKHQFGTAIHSSGVISGFSKIEEGSVVFAFAVVQPSVRIGRHSIVNTGAIIEHDCMLGEFVHVAPHATLCGGVQVGEGTLIGAGAVILPNVIIGAWCQIGAGAVVTTNVPDSSTAMGVPARTMR